MSTRLYIFIASVMMLFAGCYYGRITVSVNVQDYGEQVSTKYRYKILSDKTDRSAGFIRDQLQVYQPDVFSDDGIPIVITNKTILHRTSGSLSRMFSLLTVGILPVCDTAHSHKRTSISIETKEISLFDICVYEDRAFSIIPLFAQFVHFGNVESCFSSTSKFYSCNYIQNSTPYLQDAELCEKATAYGIAVKLKEAEQLGLIDQNLVAKAQVRIAMTDILATVQKIIDDDAARRGVQVSADKNRQGSPFEIIRCEAEQGKDFSYAFALRRKGGGAITFTDYSVVCSVFRSAIRTHYASLHLDINPRTLEIDFTDYTVKAGTVSGRVTVLSIFPESLSYDSRTRKGIIRVRVRDGQFEDARRWIRRNIGELARKSNIEVAGDAVPKEGRFFSEREEMKDGVLEVSFTIE